MTELAANVVALPPSDGHFQTLARAADNLVVFLGAGGNSADADAAWEVGSGRLPDDRELAGYIAKQARHRDAPVELAQVAQRARATHGESAVFKWLGEVFASNDDTIPSTVDKLLAGLPKHFRDHGLARRYQMIVTTKYDGGIEKAFREANEAYDVAIYRASEGGRTGTFVHVPWAGQRGAIERPNEYTDFPINAAGSALRRTVIVRFNNPVDDGLERQPTANCVITEDDYIDLLSGCSIFDVVPSQLLAKLKKANYLFLGYSIIPWRLRVFLHRVWGGDKLGGQKYWAVTPEPDQFEKDLWEQAGVTLYQEGLVQYLRGLYESVESNVEELRP